LSIQLAAYSLSPLGSAPSSSTQLGYTTNFSVSETVPYTLTNNNYTNFTFNTSGLPIGIYMVLVNCTINPTTGTNRIGLSTNYGAPTANINVIGSFNTSVNALYTIDYQYMSIMNIIKVTNATSSTLSLNIYIGGGSAGSTLNYLGINVLRIA
jgi:hypothetical protein